MRNYDFSPLGRSSIGFDRLFDIINNTKIVDAQDNYPPYDIVRTGSDHFRIVLAVAGFAPEDLYVTAQQNLLTVTGRSEQAERDYLFNGISSRPFERRFSLADHVEVAEAACANGLLRIDLVRRLPEAVKPRSIEIKGDPGAAAPPETKAA